MADNNNVDMNRLRQDAIRRAREMQARALGATPAQNTVRKSGSPPAPDPQSRSESVRRSPPPSGADSPGGMHIPIPPHGENMEQSQNFQNAQMNPVKDIFESLLSDSERTLLLVLILLLVQENADTGLIFALMYLIL